MSEPKIKHTKLIKNIKQYFETCNQTYDRYIKYKTDHL